MPNKTVNNIVVQLDDVKVKLQKHLDDGVTVISRLTKLETNMKWNTWLTTVIAGALIVQAIKLFTK